MLSTGRGRGSVAELHPWLHSPTPPYPVMMGGWRAVSATLSPEWLVWGLCGSACGEPVPSSFFFPLRTSSTSLPLALSNPLFPKLLLSHLGGGTHSSFPTSPQLKAMRKPVTVARVSLLPPPPVYHDQGRRACRILSAAFGAAGGRLSISASSSA